LSDPSAPAEVCAEQGFGHARCGACAPASTRLDSRSEVCRFGTMRPSLHFRPTPCGLPPFPAGPVGSPSFLPSPPGLTPAACLSASCPSPRSHQALRRHPRAHADAPLLGFHSPTALASRGRPYIPAACSRRHHPSSGFPTLSTSFFALNPAMDLPASSRASFATAGAPGVDPRSSRSSKAFRPGTGRTHHGGPLQGSLRSRDGHVLACPPLVRFGSLQPFSFRESSHLAFRALQSLDRRTVGSSPIASRGHRPS